MIKLSKRGVVSVTLSSGYIEEHNNASFQVDGSGGISVYVGSELVAYYPAEAFSRVCVTDVSQPDRVFLAE